MSFTNKIETEINIFFDINFNKLEENLAYVENGLNKVGYVPVLSMLTGGVVRVALGKVEVITGLFLAAVKFIQAQRAQDETIKKLLRADAGRCLGYAGHGLANIFRGTVEAFFIVGNIASALYDRVAKVRFHYESEQLPLETSSLLHTHIKPILNQAETLARSTIASIRKSLPVQNG
jgi:hypothetical protein